MNKKNINGIYIVGLFISVFFLTEIEEKIYIRNANSYYNINDIYYAGPFLKGKLISFDSGSIPAFLMFVLFIMAVVIYFHYHKDNKNNKIYQPKIGDLDKKIQKYLPNMTEEKILNILYNKYSEIENAYMNFDYSTLKKNCTFELYDSYKSDLEYLKSKEHQNIITDLKCIKYNINDITEENGIITIKMYINIESYNYIINTKTNEVISGNSNEKVNNMYHLYFITKKASLKIVCPNCGSNIENNQSECDYCNTIINNNYNDFVLSSKVKL